MNKKSISVIAVVVLISIGVYFFFNNKVSAPIIKETPKTSFDAKNANFSVDGKQVTLVNGFSEEEIIPGSASKITTRYFGNEIIGDLTGDGVPDTAFLITQSTGGSGLFYYAVVAIKTESGYKTTNAFLIGDRIAPQPMYIPGGTTELHVNFVERKPNEPITTQPSQGAVKLLKVTQEGILEGLMR